MYRTTIFLSALLFAASCQAGILSTVTLTSESQSPPLSVPLGQFGPFAHGGISMIHDFAPFDANTDYYVPASTVDSMYYMVTHPAQFETHGSMWIDIFGQGLGSYAFHYDRLVEDFTDPTCNSSDGTSCSGTLTIDGTPNAYTTPWNEIIVRYTYTQKPVGSYITNITATISNAPEPSVFLLLTIGLVASQATRVRRLRYAIRK